MSKIKEFKLLFYYFSEYDGKQINKYYILISIFL